MSGNSRLVFDVLDGVEEAHFGFGDVVFILFLDVDLELFCDLFQVLLVQVCFLGRQRLEVGDQLG